MSNIGNKEIFARNLSYYLNKCGRDQKELAAIVGVAPSTFNEWIKGKKYPRIDKIEILANFFGILKSDLIEDKRQKNHPEERELSEVEKMFRELEELFMQLPEESQKMYLEVLRATLKKQK